MASFVWSGSFDSDGLLLNSSCHLGAGLEDTDRGDSECLVCDSCGRELEPENEFYSGTDVDASIEDAMDRLAEGIEESATQFARLHLGSTGQEGLHITIQIS